MTVESDQDLDISNSVRVSSQIDDEFVALQAAVDVVNRDFRLLRVPYKTITHSELRLDASIILLELVENLFGTTIEGTIRRPHYLKDHTHNVNLLVQFLESAVSRSIHVKADDIATGDVRTIAQLSSEIHELVEEWKERNITFKLANSSASSNKESSVSSPMQRRVRDPENPFFEKEEKERQEALKKQQLKDAQDKPAKFSTLEAIKKEYNIDSNNSKKPSKKDDLGKLKLNLEQDMKYLNEWIGHKLDAKVEEFHKKKKETKERRTTNGKKKRHSTPNKHQPNRRPGQSAFYEEMSDTEDDDDNEEEEDKRRERDGLNNSSCRNSYPSSDSEEDEKVIRKLVHASNVCSPQIKSKKKKAGKRKKSRGRTSSQNQKGARKSSQSHKKRVEERKKSAPQQKKKNRRKNDPHNAEIMKSQKKSLSQYSHPYTKYAYMASRPKTAPVIRSEVGRKLYKTDQRHVVRERRDRGLNELSNEGIEKIQFVQDGNTRKRITGVDMEEEGSALYPNQHRFLDCQNDFEPFVVVPFSRVQRHINRISNDAAAHLKGDDMQPVMSSYDVMNDIVNTPVTRVTGHYSIPDVRRTLLYLDNRVKDKKTCLIKYNARMAEAEHARLQQKFIKGTKQPWK